MSHSHSTRASNFTLNSGIFKFDFVVSIFTIKNRQNQMNNRKYHSKINNNQQFDVE